MFSSMLAGPGLLSQVDEVLIRLQVNAIVLLEIHFQPLGSG